jgi:heterodisulfide reductase subunit A
MAEKKTKKETAPKKKEAKNESKAAAPAQAKMAVAPAPSAKGARIGVFICHCGTNIAGSIDINAVEEYAKTLPNVATNSTVCLSTPGRRYCRCCPGSQPDGTVVAHALPPARAAFRTATKEEV